MSDRKAEEVERNIRVPPWCCVCEQPLEGFIVDIFLPEKRRCIKTSRQVVYPDPAQLTRMNMHLDCMPEACYIFFPRKTWGEIMDLYVMLCHERKVGELIGDRYGCGED